MKEEGIAENMQVHGGRCCVPHHTDGQWSTGTAEVLSSVTSQGLFRSCSLATDVRCRKARHTCLKGLDRETQFLQPPRARYWADDVQLAGNPVVDVGARVGLTAGRAACRSFRAAAGGQRSGRCSTAMPRTVSRVARATAGGRRGRLRWPMQCFWLLRRMLDCKGETPPETGALLIKMISEAQRVDCGKKGAGVLKRTGGWGGCRRGGGASRRGGGASRRGGGASRRGGGASRRAGGASRRAWGASRRAWGASRRAGGASRRAGGTCAGQTLPDISSTRLPRLP